MAHQEAVRIGNSAALTAHTGTAGTAEMVRLVGTGAGALTVDLVSGDTITVSVGTINAGTINTLKDGTITEVQKGSIAVTAGTGIVTGGSIVVTAGTIAAGTVNVVGKYTSSLGTVTIPTSDTVQSGTTSNTFAGMSKGITLVTPELEGTGTATIQLKDSSGGTLISQAQDESVTAHYGTEVPMTSTMEWVVTANGTQSTDRTITFEVQYEQ